MKNSTIAFFPTSESPRSNGQSAGVSQVLGSQRLPEFLVRPERPYTDWWGSVRLMFSRAPRSSGRRSNHPVSGFSVASSALSPFRRYVFVVHVSLVVLLSYLPSLTRETPMPRKAQPISEAISYHLPPAQSGTRFTTRCSQRPRRTSGERVFARSRPRHWAHCFLWRCYCRIQASAASGRCVKQSSSLLHRRIYEFKRNEVTPTSSLETRQTPRQNPDNTEMSKPRQQNQQVAAETAPALTSG